MSKPISKRKLITIGLMLFFTVIAAVLATIQAYKLDQTHTEMRSLIDSIPTERFDTLDMRYPDGITIYYSLTAMSGIYQFDHLDTLYDKFEMGRWAVELSDDSNGSILLFAPDFGWNPDYSDMNEGGWLLSGEIGSSITLYNPRLDPEGSGQLSLEVIDRNRKGVVFLIDQPSPIQP